MCTLCHMAESSLRLNIVGNVSLIKMIIDRYQNTGCGSSLIKQRVEELTVQYMARRLEE